MSYQDQYEEYCAKSAQVAVGGGDRHDRRFAYRPGEVLVARRQLGQVADALTARGGAPDWATGDLPAVRYRFPDRDDLPDVVRQLREEFPRVRLGLNHVLFGAPSPFGCPAGPAQAVEPSALPGGGDGRCVTVAVLDTGISHHDAVAGRVVHTLGDEDHIDEDGNDRPDWEAGHGLFVAGVVLQGAPGAAIMPARVLHSTGAGDELMLAGGVAAVLAGGCGHCERPHILNLSLGGFTQDDQPPVAMAELLETELLQDIAIVCAAGNWGEDPGCLERPVWPAALDAPNVFAVAALGAAGGGPAPYSNLGRWVDACAPGLQTSTFLTERRQIEGNTQQDFCGWARWEGTSFAAPAFSGAIAAAMSRTGLPPLDAAALLIAGGTDRRGEGLGVEFDLAKV